jgi:O-antigen ligase
MPLTPIWRTRISAAAAAALALVLGVQIAQEALFWPMLCAGGLAALVLLRIQSQPLGTLLLGGLLVGYIVGNRGFAQLSVFGGFPLLPAEFVLLVACAILVVQCARRRDLPLRYDALNLTLFIWMLIGTVRLLFDIRVYGFAALRDYAMVYYGVFFYLAQHAARDAASARFLHRCVLVACGLLLVVHPLAAQFPNFFLSTLTLRGIPVIFYKDDLAGNFMAMGSLLFFLRYEKSRHLAWLAASLALVGLMFATNSRSSMVGLAVGAAWLAVAGRWRFVATLSAGVIVAAVGLLLVAQVRHQSWRQTPVYSIYERTMSIADPLGQRAYRDEESLSKGDNNVFRMVWWRAAVGETVESNLWFGLGFGHDLAYRFIREYFPDNTEEFTARSPHNVLITVFARMGVIGSVAFLAFLVACAVRTLRILRHGASFADSGAFWCAAWVLLVCACFGVVLEGPMGAVVFWTVLGLASATSVTERQQRDAEDSLSATTPTSADSAATPLPNAGAAVSLRPAP